MCGITGIYSYNLVGRLSMINLSRATEVLEHRGPDFQNGYNDNNVGLGHRRLSILDPSPSGHQPMSDPTGRYWLVYNGEIYNFKELRGELQGIEFQSSSDTEVLLHLLIEQGTDCLTKLNGFFAFAFYDSHKSELLLVLDRFGIKPQYYLNDQDKFIFGSEMRSIFEYGLQKEVDLEALHIFLQLNYVPAPLTLIKGVKKMKPGELIRISPEGIHHENWYEQKLSAVQVPESYKECQEQVRALLQESVSKRLVSDVPLGSFLSGGLDSSIIALEASRQKEDLHTFSVGFSEEKFFDESDYSELVAKKIGSRHTRFDLTQKKFEDSFENILNHFDEPFADSSALAYYLLSKETRQHSTVALSGDGADEIFGGYNKHLGYMRSNQGGMTNLLMRASRPFSSLLPASRSGRVSNKIRQAKKYSKSLSMRPSDRYWFLASISTAEDVNRVLANPSATDQDLIRQFRSGYSKLGGKTLNEFLLNDVKMVLPGDMLVKADRMSMAHGLEVRVPFLDHDVVNFALSLPDEHKIMGNKRKNILYDAYQEDLPEELYHRPKKGFEVPLLAWLNKSSLRYEVGKLTDPSYLADQGLFNPKQVQKLKRSMGSLNPSDVHAKLWAIITFQWWYRKNFS